MEKATNGNERSIQRRRKKADYTHEASERIRERVETVRDIVEDVRDRAELAFQEKPYLMPLTAGLVGLGVGVLLGSKLTRLLVLTAAGSLLSEVVGGEIKRLGRDFLDDMKNRLEEGDLDDAEPAE